MTREVGEYAGTSLVGEADVYVGTSLIIELGG